MGTESGLISDTTETQYSVVEVLRFKENESITYINYKMNT